MKKILCYSLLSFWSLSNPLNADAQKKYNVIFIAIDDLSIAFDTYGNSDAPAPNFTRLLEHGMLFKQAYCQYALCGPSRTSFLSGYRPDKTQIFDNKTSPRSHLGDSFKFLPEYFHQFNYYTERFGKIGPCGHETEVSWDAVYRPHFNRSNEEVDIPAWWIDTVAKNDEETRAGILTNGLIKNLKNPPSTPFFYGLGIWTHNPWTPILSEWNKIGDPSVKELLPVDIKGTITDVRGNGSANITLPHTPPDDTADIPRIALKDLLYYSTADWKRLRHAYYAEISAMDFQLGEVLDAMDAFNLWDNNIIVFVSDHGLHLGEHNGLWLKQTLFEESSRVPFVICAPGKKTGICNKLVELVDIFPTLTELCGLPAPADLEGSSLVPLLENPAAIWKKAIFSQVRRSADRGITMGRSVRTNNLHYNSWENYGEELYDIKNDPYEYTNLANDAAHEDDLNKMRRLLANGWKGALPPVYTRKSYYKDSDGDGYGNSNDSIIAYFKSDDYTEKKGDCDDNNANIHPNAIENNCNGIDDNCNGQTDEDKLVPTITATGSLDICQTGSVVLKTDKGESLSYQWKKDGANIAGATQRRYTATEIGTYKVTVTDSVGCSVTSKKVTVTNSCDGIALKGVSLSKATASYTPFSLYPNPTRGNLNIIYKSYSAGTIQLRVVEIVGKTLLVKTEQTIKGTNIFQLDLGRLKPGTYYLELNNSTLQKCIKFMIER